MAEDQPRIQATERGGATAVAEARPAAPRGPEQAEQERQAAFRADVRAHQADVQKIEQWVAQLPSPAVARMMTGLDDTGSQRRDTTFWTRFSGAERNGQALTKSFPPTKLPREVYVTGSADAMYRRPAEALGKGIDPPGALAAADEALQKGAREIGLNPASVMGRYVSGSHGSDPVRPELAAAWREREAVMVMRARDPYRSRDTFTKADLQAAAKTVEAFHREAQGRYDAIQRHRDTVSRETRGVSREGPSRDQPSRDGGYGL